MVKEICSSRLESHSSQKLKKPQKVVRRGGCKAFCYCCGGWDSETALVCQVTNSPHVARFTHEPGFSSLALSLSWFAQCCKMTVGNYASDFYPQNPQSNHKNPFCQQVVLKGTKEPEIILIPFP